MALYWFLGLTAIALLFWFIARSNKQRVHSQYAKDLASENYRLRNVVVSLSMDKHNSR